MKAEMGKPNTHNGKHICNRSLVCDSKDKSTKRKG